MVGRHESRLCPGGEPESYGPLGPSFRVGVLGGLDGVRVGSEECRRAPSAPGRRARGPVPLFRACRRRRSDAACPQTVHGALRPPRREVAHRRRRGRPDYRQGRVRAQPWAPADPRLEREARGLVRVPARARAELPLLDGRARRGRAGRLDLARGHLPQGLRRPDALDARPPEARLAALRAGHPAGGRADRRRRVVLRRKADGPGLEAVVLHQRVRSALGADGRPRSVPGSHHARAGPRGGPGLSGRAAAGRYLGRGAGDDRHGPRDSGPAGVDRVGAARADPPLHEPRERQLHRRDPPQAARRRLRAPGHDRRRSRGRAPAPGRAADPARRSAHRRRLGPFAARPADCRLAGRECSSRAGSTRISARS